MKLLRYAFALTFIIFITLVGVSLTVAGSAFSIFNSIFNELAGKDGVESRQFAHASHQAARERSKEPISLEGKTVAEILCLLGDPQTIVAAGVWPWELYFEGPFFSDSENLNIAHYAAIRLNWLSRNALEKPIIHYVDELRLFGEPVRELPKELRRLHVVALPQDEKRLVRQLGEWTVAHSRGKNTKRVIYAQPVCFGGEPYDGLVVSIESQRVTRGSAIRTYERLARAEFDLRTYREDDDDYAVSDYFRDYGSEPVARGGAVDTLLTYIVSLEFREYEKAKKLLADYIENPDMRFRLNNSTDHHESINVATLKYKVVDVSEGKVDIDTQYQLTNGLLVGGRYTLMQEHGKWRVSNYVEEALEQIYRKDKLVSKIPRPSGPIYFPENIDEASIRYVDQKPIDNSPQAALIYFLLHKENGESELAEEYISKTAPKWKKRSLLRRGFPTDGPIEMPTLRYQIMEINDGVYRVNHTLNFESGTFQSGTSAMIIEDGRWKIK